MELLELLEKIEKALDEKLEETEKYRTPRKKAQVSKKRRLMAEKDEIEEKLKTVTDNYYAEIGEFVNEYLEEEIILLKKTYKKCKNWLDENEIKGNNDEDDNDYDDDEDDYDDDDNGYDW